MMSSAILDIQCVLGPNSKYLIKEMSVVDLEGLASQHWIFKHSRTPNTSKIEAANMWLFRNYHQLSSDCGDVQYSEIEKILKSLHFECIYVKGEEKRQIIQDFIPNVEIIEMGADLDCPRLDQLHAGPGKNLQPCCLYHMDLDSAQCTYNRVFALLKWFKNNM
jgi:hypothetical protein